MVCGLAAAVGMAVLSAFSARDLFRLYSQPGAGRRTRRAQAQHQQLLRWGSNRTVAAAGRGDLSVAATLCATATVLSAAVAAAAILSAAVAAPQPALLSAAVPCRRARGESPPPSCSRGRG